MNKKKILSEFFFLTILILIISYLFISDTNIKKLSKNEIEIKHCSNLSFEESKKIKHINFGSFEIDLKIKNQRKWKQILIRNAVSTKKDNSYTYRGQNVDADLVIKTKSGIKCKIRAKVKPHGDLDDHYVDTHKGNRFIYNLPSIKVNLLDGHIFGIVKFRLFKPKTRNNGNEIFATTLLEELNMLAPRTSFVNVKYNNENFSFIFQEKITKEFLEFNNLLEGPIYSGDERFVFKYNEWLIHQKESGISKHKLVDKKWANLSANNNDIASEALEFLNWVNYFYKSEISQVMLVDYHTSLINTDYLDFFKELPKFDSLLFAIGATHNLSRDDRRFYYDQLNRIFLPIYYDGMLSIFDKNNFLINNNKFILAFSNHLNHVGVDKISKSAIDGSPEALHTINRLNLKLLHEKLISRGFNITFDQLDKAISVIKNNLRKMNNFPEDKIIKVSNEIQHPIKNEHAYQKKIKAKYIFENKESNNFEICDLILEKCNFKLFDLKTKTTALEQKLKDKNGFQLIYQGKIKNPKKNSILSNDLLSQYKQIKIENNTVLNVYGDLKLEINREVKKINLKKINVEDKVAFKGGVLNDWTINFIDNSIKNKNFSRRDKNGLSGCLNFYDMEVKNLKLIINDAVCEDAVNFVRTNGKISFAKISNSLFDSIDLDFSKILLKEVIINNSGNDCIDLSFGNYTINTIDIKNCSDKGISVGEDSNVLAKNIYIKNTKYGIASKDYSILKVLKGEIVDTEICMAAYSKKQEFSGSHILTESVSCKDTKQISQEKNGSKIESM